MHQRPLIFAGVLLFLVTFAIGLTINPAVRADALLQDVPRLDGYKIYFTDDNGEASRFDRSNQGLSRFAGLLAQLGANLNTLEWRTDVPSDADLIIIAGPTSLSGDQIARLWSYLNNNQGRLLFLAGSSLDTGGIGTNNDLFALMWADMGVYVRNDVVVKESYFLENVTPDTPAVIAQFATSLLDPSHPITENLSGALTFFQARSLALDISDRAIQVTPLVFSDSNFYGETRYGDFLSDGRIFYNIGEDTSRGSQILAAAVDNPIKQSRMIVIGDRDFAINGMGLGSSPPSSDRLLYPENARFLVRAVAWLLDADPSTTQSLTFGKPEPTATSTPVPTPRVLNADVGVTLSVNNLTPSSGDSLIYNVTVTNNGPDTADNVSVNVILPGGITYAFSNATSQTTYDPQMGFWSVGSLTPAATAELSIVVMVDDIPQSTGISVTAEVAGSDINDNNAENNSATTTIIVNSIASLNTKPIMAS